MNLTDILLTLAVVLMAVMLIIVVLLLRRKIVVDMVPIESALQPLEKSYERTERSLRDEIAKNREESSIAARQTREELAAALKGVVDGLHQQLSSLTQSNDRARDMTEQRQHSSQQDNTQKLELGRQDAAASAKSLREEVAALIKTLGDTVAAPVGAMASAQTEKLTGFADRLDKLAVSVERKLDSARDANASQLVTLQEANAKQMVQVREESSGSARALREEVVLALKALGETISANMSQIADAQKSQLQVFSGQLDTLTASTDQKLTAMRHTIDDKMRAVQEENARQLSEARHHTALESKALREEVAGKLKLFSDTSSKTMTDIANVQKGQLESFSQQLLALTATNEAKLTAMREVLEQRLGGIQEESGKRLEQLRVESLATTSALREEVGGALKAFNEAVATRMTDLASLQKVQLDNMQAQVAKLTESNEQKLDVLRNVVEEKLKALQDDNGKQLEQMRQTVDEKLQGTLEKRLGESFKQVSDRLELVHRGLGEMQTLATGVGDLKKVLTNVKTRGTWGEVQLGALLEQVLTPDQYAKNVATKGQSERVEFAIKLPGRDSDPNDVVWLPIDAKFPVEDYQRLVAAQERADADGVEQASKGLENAIKSCAKDIYDKYVSPPQTTDFAILFLPTEGLFAEVLRRPGLADYVQRECRVVLAGPTTLWSVLNSLQMGFRTLAIQQRSGEVWKLLAAVKTEWGKYGDVLKKVQKKLNEASSTLEDVEVRSRAIGKKLKNVEELPAQVTTEILALGPGAANDVRGALSSYPPAKG